MPACDCKLNALQDLASFPGTNSYSSRWQGPPPPTFLPYGQLAALDVLNSVTGFTPGPTRNRYAPTYFLRLAFSDIMASTTSQLPSGSQTSTLPASSSTPTGRRSTSFARGPIIGGVLAGVVVLVGSVLVIVIIRYRHKRRDVRSPTIPHVTLLASPTTHASLPTVRAEMPSTKSIRWAVLGQRRHTPRSGSQAVSQSTASGSSALPSSTSGSHMRSPSGNTLLDPPMSRTIPRSPADLEALVHRLDGILARLPPEPATESPNVAPPQYER